MSATWQVRALLLAALGQVDGLRAYETLSESLEPPAVLVSAPRLTWALGQSEPTEATYSVVVVVPADERALQRLDVLVPQVAAAIDGTDIGVVRTAEPGTWDVGGISLPCYFVETEVAL